MDPNGDELLCSGTNLTPDDTNQLSTCPIEKDQLFSGDWSVILISNNGDECPIAYERDFYLTVGVPATTTYTPTVTLSASKCSKIEWKWCPLTFYSGNADLQHDFGNYHDRHRNDYRHRNFAFEDSEAHDYRDAAESDIDQDGHHGHCSEDQVHCSTDSGHQDGHTVLQYPPEAAMGGSLLQHHSNARFRCCSLYGDNEHQGRGPSPGQHASCPR